MKRYIAPTYEKEAIETEDIMTASVIIDQDGDTTNASTTLDQLLGSVEQKIRFDN